MDTEGLENNPPRRRRKRSVRALLVVLAVVLLFGLAGLLWVWKMQERQEFVSKVDPTTGYRCRFTVEADWRHKYGSTGPKLGGRYDIFTPLERGAVRQWIEAHLLPHSLSHSDAGEISLFVEQRDSSVLSQPPNYAVPPLSERHLTIDGCPAKVEMFAFSMGGSSLCETVLSIDTPDRKLSYELVADYTMQDDPIDREMQKIIHSFHIEKVGKLAGKQ